MMKKIVVEEIKTVTKEVAIDTVKAIINLPKELFIDTPKEFVRSIRYLAYDIADGVNAIVEWWKDEEEDVDTNEEDIKAYNEWLEKYKANPSKYHYSIVASNYANVK